MPEPLSDERLAAIEARHRPDPFCFEHPDRPGEHCFDCAEDWPCDVVALLAEVRRLREDRDRWQAAAEYHYRDVKGLVGAD